MENNSGDENSDDGLQIVIETPKPKKRIKKELNEADRKIIECVEKDLEDNLEEKAAKAKLTAKNVKNIIKEVITNEHVLALVRHAENPNEEIDESITVYEPKYTRAKTKELLSTNTQPKILPWPSTKKVSEVQVLFSEDLQEDSSGDEYVPARPTKKSSVESPLDTSQGTIKNDEEANIARRTRSKLSLSHTPLEVIEEAFMPPDITTDMYNMDCDDEVWKEFLKTFTRPLDEVTKAAEDEDHDPEYNVLADEEIDKVDKEELRADRAVTVSRKELNCLVAELFEFADIYESNKLNEKCVIDDQNLPSIEQTKQDGEQDILEDDSENDPNICIQKCQVPILAQQMRQHVQMLTQNYLLSYQHPEFADMAAEFKQMLNDIKAESEGKTASICHALNLKPAFKLIEDWEQLFENNNKEAIECKRYIEKVIVESIERNRAGTVQYIVTFPKLLMKTVSNSEVFLYPNLLPRVPFKSNQITRSRYHYFTNGEERLIALFLEQSIPHLKQDAFYLTKYKQINMERVCQLINKLLMPSVKPSQIWRCINTSKSPKSGENPITFFFCYKKAPPIVHYVVPMDSENILPPCKRSPDSLPYQWREYLYPNQKNEKRVTTNDNNNQIIVISSPLQVRPVTSSNTLTPYNGKFCKKVGGTRKILPKAPIPITNYSRRKKRSDYKSLKYLKNKFNRENKQLLIYNSDQIEINMLPDMPSLGGTPIKNKNLESETNLGKDTSTSDNQEHNLSFKNITNFDYQFLKPESGTQVRRNFEGINQFSNAVTSQRDSDATTSDLTEKDNPDDINELMIASSTVKNVTKKEPSGAEKKRAKMRREFVANLVMATPDGPEIENQKDENFADAFCDKLRQTLNLEEYDRLMDILGHYDESNDEFLDLYKNVQSILYPTYKELSEEFLLFLTDIQAHEVGQLMPYFVMKDMDRFLKKLQIYFKDQPTQMKKIIKSLTELSDSPDISMESIKNTIVPLLKGNAALTDWFLQLFPCEKPPKILTTGPHELIDISKELARLPDEDICETVTLPDVEDPYGGSNCICFCHNVENPQFQSRSQHCKNCGLKFIQGKVYIQTGKALRPAVVSFVTNPEKDHSKRLAATQRKRSETSPSKQVTLPTKDNQTHEEPRNSNDSEDEGDSSKKKKQRQPKSQRKRKIKERDKTNTKDSGKSNKEVPSKSCDKKSDNVKPAKSSIKRQSKKKMSTINKTPERKPGSAPGQHKRLAEQEIEYTEPAELVDLKVGSDHSGESGSEFFESSQDITNTDSEESIGSPNLSPVSSKPLTWTREEDKIILQAFRQRSDNEETFKHISGMLQNRSVVDVKNRFHKLMSLLQQMASKS